MSVAMRVVVFLARFGAALSLRNNRAVTVLDSVQVNNLGQYLRFSYRVDHTAVQLVSQQTPIFNVPAGSVVATRREKYSSSNEYAEDAAELSNQNNRNLNLDLTVSPFNAAAERSTEMGASWVYKIFRSDVYEKYEKYHVSSTTINRVPWLTPDVRSFLLTRSPADIERRIGTFYVLDVRLGAQLKFSHLERKSWKETRVSMSEKFNAGYKKELAVNTGVDGNYQSVTTDNSRKVKVARKVVGGKAKAWLSLKADSSNLQQVKKEWAKGVTDATLFPVEMSLAPIWTLLQGINSSKAGEVKSYFERKWKVEKQKLKHFPDGPHLMRCNWKDQSICWPGGIGAALKCPDQKQCVKTGSKVCWLPIPGLQAKCDCNSVCWQYTKNNACCRR